MSLIGGNILSGDRVQQVGFDRALKVREMALCFPMGWFRVIEGSSLPPSGLIDAELPEFARRLRTGELLYRKPTLDWRCLTFDAKP